MKKTLLLLSLFAVILASSAFAQEAIMNSSSQISLNENISGNLVITNFFPIETNVGDIQFNIQVLNNYSSAIKNVYAFIIGNGFTPSDIIPADTINPWEKSYIFVKGNLRQGGNISLKIILIT